jgi:hypothetical protein
MKLAALASLCSEMGSPETPPTSFGLGNMAWKIAVRTGEELNGVADGIRTRNSQLHKLGLYH